VQSGDVDRAREIFSQIEKKTLDNYGSFMKG